MENEVERVSIQRVTREDRQDIEDIVIKELPLTIILNNQELVTLLCSPVDLEHLAVGFLFSEGLLNSKDEIKKVIVDNRKGVVRVETVEDKELDSELVFRRLITSGCGRGASLYNAADLQTLAKVESRNEISIPEVFTLVKEFQRSSPVYKASGGVHSAVLCDTQNILIFNEDIGRHNAIDKIFGKCLLEDIPTDGRIIVTSGRVSSEILLKVAKRNIPIIISVSAPTDVAVRLADSLDIALVGFVRGSRLNIYTHNWRIKTDGN